MPLLNVYQYLNVVKPHIAYRFNCDIWPYRSDNNNREDVDPQYRRRTYAVKKISQPVFKFDLENKKYFGNTQFIIPILKFSESELEITFEETDDMEIYKFLAERYSESPFMRSSISGLVNIEITQFDETMKNIVDKKHYIAMLKSFDTPTFNNNGYGSPLEISAIFNILYIFDGRIEEEGIDNKIGLKYNSDTQKLERKPINRFDFTDHLIRAKKAEPGIDKEITNAYPNKNEIRSNPEVDARRAEIKDEISSLNDSNVVSVLEGFSEKLNGEDRLTAFTKARENYEIKIGGENADLDTKTKVGKEFTEKFNSLSRDDQDTLLVALAYGIDITDGISNEEFNMLNEMSKDGSFDSTSLSIISQNLKREQELNQELKDLKYTNTVLYKPTEGPTGKKIAATGGIGKERITRESIKELVIAEFLGTNGTRRKEGNSNLVYMNSNDGGKQKANFGMGNTQKYLENIGLDSEKFTIINTKTNETVTGTLEELTNAVKSSDSQNESTASVWRLDEKSANRIENVSMSHITERVINSVDSEILANMDAATIGGYSHIEYGSGGSLKILGSYLNEHKAEAIADLKANNGQFSDNFVNEMMNNPKVNKIMYTKWQVKDGKNKGNWNSIDRRGNLTGRTGYSFKRIS